MKVACIQSSAGENYIKNFSQIILLINLLKIKQI